MLAERSKTIRPNSKLVKVKNTNEIMKIKTNIRKREISGVN